jgi:hypothetical protein
LQELRWMKEEYGFSSIQDCIKLANRFFWNVSIVHHEDGKVFVLAGDQVIFSSDNMPAMEAFLYGMGLAYSVIPRHMAEELGREIGLDDEDMRALGFN